MFWSKDRQSSELDTLDKRKPNNGFWKLEMSVERARQGNKTKNS